MHTLAQRPLPEADAPDSVGALPDRPPADPRHRASFAPSCDVVVAARHWGASRALIERLVPFTRRTVHSGDCVQRAGDAFTGLSIVNAGVFKSLSRSTEGLERVACLHFKGDWIGFDAIGAGRCPCDVVALETGEVWHVGYGALLDSAAAVPALMHAVHSAMSVQAASDREWRLALTGLSADARVANFVRFWVVSQGERGLRTDQTVLLLSRSEIGSYLGLTIESVSRAFCRLARLGLIRFDGTGRRQLSILSLEALVDFVRRP